jgi:hypothetical protein
MCTGIHNLQPAALSNLGNIVVALEEARKDLPEGSLQNARERMIEVVGSQKSEVETAFQAPHDISD